MAGLTSATGAIRAAPRIPNFKALGSFGIEGGKSVFQGEMRVRKFASLGTARAITLDVFGVGCMLTW